MKLLRHTIFFFFFFLLITPCYSVDIELYGNYHTMGVIIDISSVEDPENDAIAILEYTIDGGSYQVGFAPTRVSNTQLIGSIFWLEPDNAYDIKVTIIDGTTATLDGTVLIQSGNTRPDPSWVAASNSYYVSPTGSGTQFTESSPGALADAIPLLNPGEEIVLLGGTYYEGEYDIANSGTATNPVTIRAKAGETVIMDGSDPASFVWTNEGDDIYSTTINTSNTKLVVADGHRLYGYDSYSDMQNQIWNQDGFYEDNGTLYVKTVGINPNNVEMNISNQHEAFYIGNRDYIHFRDITFRYYGQGSWAKALYFNSSSYNVVDNCVFAINNLGIGVKYESDQLTVQNCEFYDDTDLWDWDGMKATIVESTLLSFYNPVYGRGHVIRNNTFHHCMDGISPGSWHDNGKSNEMDIYNNLIYNAGDDGISADGLASNVRLWNNTMYDLLVGISFAPVLKGPVYAIRNLIYDTGYGNSDYRGMSFKYNSGYDPSGVMYIFNNTSDASMSGVDGIEYRVPGDWDMVISRNNAYTGTRFALSYIKGGDYRPIDMDYDNLYTTNEGEFAYWYDNQSYHYTTLSEFQNETGQEVHGINERPEFVSPTTGNFTLQPSSELIDKGVYIPGINDGFNGTSPDIGAFEYQSSLGVELLRFSLHLQQKDNAIRLDWVTGSEVDNKGFEIQKLNKIGEWEKIGWKNGKVSSNSKEYYNYIDNNPIIGYNYYRLKQEDFNESIKYSEINSILFDKGMLELSIFPNPSSKSIRISSPNQDIDRYRIYNQLGQEVGSGDLKIDNEVDISNLDRGIYVISLWNDKNLITGKFVKE